MDPLNLHHQSVTLESLEALPPTGQIILTVLYSATAIVSFLGNSLVLVVLLCSHKLRFTERQTRQSIIRNDNLPSTAVAKLPSGVAVEAKLVRSKMKAVSFLQHPPRSDNLRHFLINLALSDMAMSLFSIPFTYTDFMLGRWVFPAIFCRLASTINVLAITVSVYSLVLISLDRYCAIVRPLLCSSSFISRHSTFLIGFTWLFAFTLASPQLLVTSVVPFQVQNETYATCRENWPSHVYSDIYSTLIIVITFVLPLCLLSVIYGRIILRIVNRDQNLFVENGGQEEYSRSAGQSYRHRSSVKAIRMIITIVVSFFVCWTPIQLFYFIIWTYGLGMAETDQSPSMVNLYVCTFFAFHFLAMAHSIVNPVIYCFMCENFQKSLRLIVSKICTSKRTTTSTID